MGRNTWVTMMGVGLLLGCGDRDSKPDTGDPPVDSPTDSCEPELWWADTDSDGYGDSEAETENCEQPDGHVAAGGDADCDDANATIHPGADEHCDGVDEDCDGSVDEDAVDGAYGGWTDADGDTFGDPDSPVAACEPADGVSDNDRDCDDSDPDVFPWNMETQGDGVDSDCDGFDDPTTLEAMGLLLTGTGEGAGAGASVAIAGDVNADGHPDLLVGGSGDTGGVWLIHGPITAGGSLADSAAVMPAFGSDYQVGYAVAGAGDVDADGFDDILIGAPGAAPGELDQHGNVGSAGEALLVYGPVTGAVDLEHQAVRLLGDNDYWWLGYDIAGVGDTNGDGFDDWVAGTKGYSWDKGARSRAYLILGSSRAPESLEQDAIIIDVPPAGMVHEPIKSTLAGDLDGDGLDDLVLCDMENARAWILHGPIISDLSTDDADVLMDGTYYNSSSMGGLSAGGDMNGDGHPDLALGFASASSEAAGRGVVLMVSGPFPSSVDLPNDAAVIMNDTVTSFPGGISFAGDLDEDGHDELMVGAHGCDKPRETSGAAYLAFGPVTGHAYISDVALRLDGAAESEYAGWSVAAGTDLDGDGIPDAVIGVPGRNGSDDTEGAAIILSGALFGAWRADGGVL